MPKSEQKIRYAIVGAGWIAQEMMPVVAHTGNSTIAAIVTGHRDKGQKLAQRYGVPRVDTYDRYDLLLRSGDIDAVYIATPNEQHAEYAIPALQAGVHVLLEKPLEVDVERGLAIASAVHGSSAKLMVAYRLHFEPATVAAIRQVRSGRLGELRAFSSVFAQPLSPSNHRAQMGFNSGPVLDMGVYPINAARNLFEAEPEEVFAIGARHPEAGLGDFDDTVAVSLRFSGGRMAQLVVSYSADAIDEYTILGSRGSLRMSPAFLFHRALRATLTVGGQTSEQTYPETDQFGGELKYFSDCILEDREPEPNVLEGLADVRVAEAIRRSLEGGTVEKLARFRKAPRLTDDQQVELEPLPGPDLVGAEEPTHG